MNETAEQRIGGLSKLAIDRSKRPTLRGRGWLALLLIVVAVAGLAAGAGWWYYRTTGTSIVAALGERPMDVNLLVVPTVQSASQPVVLVATGKIVSDRRVFVATKVSGQIVELDVEQGDRVEAGQVLARVEDVVYRAQRDQLAAALAQQRSELTRSVSERARAQADVLQVRANYEYEKRNFNRLESLKAIGQASDLEYLDAKNRFEAAEAALRAAEAAADSAAAAIEVTRAQCEAAEAQLRVAQKRLDDCAIRAPIGGVVLERNAQVGDFLAAEGGLGANANAQLVSIADMELLRVEIDISERDVHRLSPDQPARVTPDADTSRAYSGFVLWIDPIGDYARATVQAKVRIVDPGPDLRVGGSAKVEFLGPAPASEPAGGARQVFWLPKEAFRLTPGSDEAIVFTVVEGRAAANPVRIGARTDKSVEVREGVYPGMQIIADGVADLSNGAAVRVVRTGSASGR